MASLYQINLNSPVGQRLASFDGSIFSMDLTRQEKQVGKLIVNVPISYWPIVSEYCQIEVWRQPTGGTYYLEGDTLWVILTVMPYVTDKGEYILQLVAVDANILLVSRIVAYYTGTAQTKKTGLAGNIIKDIARENISSAASDYIGSTTRGISAANFTVQSNLGDGASVSSAFAWRVILDAMNEIADKSATAGTYISFDCFYDPATQKIDFRTYAGQRGTDRTINSNNYIILDPELGNIGESSLTYDYSSEVNFVYCGGQDTGTNRVIRTAFDTVRMGVSPFSRRETFQDARQSDLPQAVQDQADAALRDGKGTVVYTGKALGNTYFAWGLNYYFGDIIPCQFKGRLVNCRLNAYHIAFSNAVESIDVVLTGVL